MHNKKLLSYVLSGTLLRTASLIALRNCSEEGREEPGRICRSFLLKKKQVGKHQKITANRKTTDTSNDFSAFLSMRRCKKLDSKNFLLKYLSECLFASFPSAFSASSLTSTPNSLQGVLKASNDSG